MRFALLGALAAAPGLALANYVLEENLVGSDFLDKFNFFSYSDPTHGYVAYQTREQALGSNLTWSNNNTFGMRTDDWTYNPVGGRASVRISSAKTYGNSLVVLDVRHMPTGCGTWPAFWSTTVSDWPNGGEIDVIEGVNGAGTNAVTLHTSSGCTMAKTRNMTAHAQNLDCASDNSHLGCDARLAETDSFGPSFNKNGGGTFAMQRDTQGIWVWFFPRNATLPADLASGKTTIDTTTWPVPSAAFLPSETCDLNKYFEPHVLIFNNSLCGDWAGDATVWKQSGCPAGTCVDYVASNPSAFSEAYWDIASLKTYGLSSSY